MPGTIRRYLTDTLAALFLLAIPLAFYIATP